MTEDGSSGESAGAAARSGVATPARPAVEHPTEVLFVLLLAGVTFALAQTLLLPALPALTRHLDASPSAGSWILTGFLLSASVATPIVGKLGDVYGKGRVLTGVMVLFSIGAVINALANSVEVLIAGRVLQGVAGGVFPLAFGIIRDTFPRERIPAAVGMVSAILGIGAGIGLPLSGFIVDHFDVKWLFLINLLSVPAAVAAHRLIPASATIEHARIDWLGAALLSVALAAVLLGVTQAGALGWDAPATVGLLAGGVAVAALWMWVEARTQEPFMDLDLLRQPSVAATNLTGFMVGLALFAGFLLVPQLAQAPRSSGYGFGSSVTVAGLLILPTALIQLVAGPLAGRLGPRVGFRAVLATGAGLISASFVVMALAHAHEWELMVAGVLLGSGIAFAFASMANLIVAATPQADVGVATGINTVMRTMGSAFGIAITTAILAGTTSAGGGRPTEQAYTAAFAFSAFAGLLALGAALLVPSTPKIRVAAPPAVRSTGAR